MIYPLAGLLIGAIAGAISAKLKGGKLLDLIQWAAVGAMMCGVIGLFVLVFIMRSYV